jgi:hypothetical protein
MIQFKTTILQFDEKGEKTGWSYIEISEKQSEKLNPGCRVSFRVKGQIDNYTFEKVALLPMGDGSFILPVNGEIRKAIKKKRGDSVKVIMQLDKRQPALSPELMKCLADDPHALSFFKSLPKSHQNYISKWIESAKTSETKTKRIVIAVLTLSSKQGFREMIRANKNNPY